MKFILVTILITFLSFFNLSAQCISGNCQNGIGTYLVNNQGKYVGEFQKSQFLGKGIFYYLNGDKFLGRWANGIQNGKGKLITAEYQYIGQFKNGEFDGFGTRTYNNGQKDQGNFQKGELIERSTYVDDGIATSVNTSVKNEPIVESQATSSYSNQYKYTTNCNNTYCDQEYGTYKYKDGSIYKGFFKQGKPEGSGTVNYTNGNHYEGEWKNHVPNGMGAFVFNDGVRAEGLWSNGKFLQEKEIHNTRSSQIPNQQVVQSDEAKIYAVVVGVASYNHMPSLKFTDDDAYKMYAFLKSPEGGALPDDQIKILVDDSHMILMDITISSCMMISKTSSIKARLSKKSVT